MTTSAFLPLTARYFASGLKSVRPARPFHTEISLNSGSAPKIFATSLCPSPEAGCCANEARTPQASMQSKNIDLREIITGNAKTFVRAVPTVRSNLGLLFLDRLAFLYLFAVPDPDLFAAFGLEFASRLRHLCGGFRFTARIVALSGFHETDI